MTTVQLILDVSVTDSSNNTRYICRVMNEEYTGMSDAIAINVGGKLLYLSMLIIMSILILQCGEAYWHEVCIKLIAQQLSGV